MGIYDSDDNVRYYHDSKYDRRHKISNIIVPNKSRKYQQGMKIDDHDYDGDDEDSNKSKQQQNQKEEEIHQKEKAIERNKNKQRNNINKNNMIAHIRYADLETNRSVEICGSTFWCYFNSHGDITRMIHDPLSGKKKKRRIPVTIAAKVSSSRINRKIHKKYINWLFIRKFWKQLLNIPEAIPELKKKA